MDRSSLRSFFAHRTKPEFLIVAVGAGIAAAGAASAIAGSGISLLGFGTAAALIGLWLLLTAHAVDLSVAREDALAARRELDLFIEYLRHSVIEYDPNFTIRHLNRSAEELFRVKAEDVVGRRLDPGSIRDPELAPLAQTLFPSLAPGAVELSEAGQWPQVVSVTLEHPHTVLHTVLHRITDVAGEPFRFLKVVEDRTHEQEILQSKTEFITVAAHQLRTPLTAMGWLIGTISTAVSENPELSENVRQLRELSDRTLKITNDLLDTAKIEEGRFGYSFESSDLVPLVRTVVHESTAAASEYGIKVFFTPPPSPEISVRIDPARIATVLTNFIDNAIKYNTEHGTVTVRVEELSDAPMVRVSVEDTGIGVPPDDLPKLFGKLQRGSNAAEVQPNGSGLGLYIARNIVERHGGAVGIESTLDRGTTAWFTLPRTPAA